MAESVTPSSMSVQMAFRWHTLPPCPSTEEHWLMLMRQHSVPPLGRVEYPIAHSLHAKEPGLVALVLRGQAVHAAERDDAAKVPTGHGRHSAADVPPVPAR
jgi:hypothetical protein